MQCTAIKEAIAQNEYCQVIFIRPSTKGIKLSTEAGNSTFFLTTLDRVILFHVFTYRLPNQM